MFSTTLGEAVQATGRRSIRVTVLPSTVFCTLVLTVPVLANDWTPIVSDRWLSLSGDAKALAAGVFVIAVLLVAAVMDSAQSALLRGAEGYWGPLTHRFPGRLGRRHHARRLRHSVSEDVHHRYPPLTRAHEVMPTTLGNILKSAETYPSTRYGIDAVLVWPRLFHVLPDGAHKVLGAARADLSAQLVRAFLMGVLALGGAGYAFGVSAPIPLFLGFLWGGGLLSWLFYRGAVNGAVVYGQHLRTMFDLHRGLLLKAVGDNPGTDAAAERDLWERWCLFWHRGVPRDHQRSPFLAPADAPSPDEAPGGPVSPSLSQTAALLLVAVGIVGALLLLWRS